MILHLREVRTLAKVSLGVVLCQDLLYYTPVHIFVVATLSFEVQHLLLEMSITSCLYIYVLLGSSLPNMWCDLWKPVGCRKMQNWVFDLILILQKSSFQNCLNVLSTTSTSKVIIKWCWVVLCCYILVFSLFQAISQNVILRHPTGFPRSHHICACRRWHYFWHKICLTPKASAAATRMWTGLYEIIALHAGWGFCAEKLTIISQNPRSSIGGRKGAERAPPWQQKKLPKIRKKRAIREREEKSIRKGKNLGRKGKNWEGSFTLPILIDRASYATAKRFLKNHKANKRLAFTNLSVTLMQNSNIEMKIWLLNLKKMFEQTDPSSSYAWKGIKLKLKFLSSI